MVPKSYRVKIVHIHNALKMPPKSKQATAPKKQSVKKRQTNPLLRQPEGVVFYAPCISFGSRARAQSDIRIWNNHFCVGCLAFVVSGYGCLEKRDARFEGALIDCVLCAVVLRMRI